MSLLQKRSAGFAPLLVVIGAAIIIALGTVWYFKFGPMKNQLPVSTGSNARNDFGCWPPTCSLIPDPQGKQLCEDWKAGKPVTWPSCSYFSGQPACQKLCEAETKVITQNGGSQTANVPIAAPCNLGSLQRQFSNSPYYTGPLFDAHFHMPQMFKIPNNPDAPVIDQDVSRYDVACLFSNKTRIKNVFAFYGIPITLKEQSVAIAQDIEKHYPGTMSPFIELVSFPGYPVVPKQVDQVLNTNKDLFKGYGELSLYLPFYSDVKPNDPAMYELYKVAAKHHLVVMMHLTKDEQQPLEEALRNNPNTTFLIHAVEDLPWANTFFDTFFDKYPNLYYSVDIDLVKDAIFPATTKQDFINRMKQGWQNMLNTKVAFWKNKIEKYPDRFLWGTDRGHYAWHYDPEVEAYFEEFGRAFIGKLDTAVQEKYAHKNAEALLQKR